MKKIYFTWSGIGDNLALIAAAYNYFLKTHEKILIGSKLSSLNSLCNYADFTQNFYFEKLNINNKDKIISDLRDNGYEPVFITANKYKYLAPSYNNCITPWPEKHIITRYCEKIGITGKVKIDIPLDLSKIPCDFDGKSYICIMTGGLQNYKRIKTEVSQGIIDGLSNRYTFVQLGSQHDALLKNVIDKRGVSLSQALGLLRNALFFIGGVGGLVHLAKAANCKSVVLQTTGEPAHLTFYEGNVLVNPVDYCDICARNLRDPQHQQCFYGYKCSSNFDAKQILNIIDENLNSLSTRSLNEQWDIASQDKANGLEDYYPISKVLWCESAFNH